MQKQHIPLRLAALLGLLMSGVGMIPASGQEPSAGERKRGLASIPLISPFIDPEDGWVDMSSFLDRPFGFFPMVMPITEPAVGAGGAVVPLFIRLPKHGGNRPNIYAAGALATSNGSKGYVAGYSGYFDDGRWHVFGGGGDLSVNLNLTAFGGFFPQREIRYNLDMVGGLVGVDRSLGSPSWRAGLRYLYGEVRASLVRPDDWPLIADSAFFENFKLLESETIVSSLQGTLSYDTRDNIFTPTKGVYSEVALTANLEALGGSTNYQILDWVGIWYRPIIHNKLFFGWRADFVQSFGDVPFYRHPAIMLRGVPARSFQGAGLVQTELELRWQFHPRWSLVGFGGAGLTWTARDYFNQTAATFTGGGGLRYLIARKYGLHTGVDVAYGDDGIAVYIQFGSGWFRP